MEWLQRTPDLGSTQAGGLYLHILLGNCSLPFNVPMHHFQPDKSSHFSDLKISCILFDVCLAVYRSCNLHRDNTDRAASKQHHSVQNKSILCLQIQYEQQQQQQLLNNPSTYQNSGRYTRLLRQVTCLCSKYI